MTRHDNDFPVTLYLSRLQYNQNHINVSQRSTLSKKYVGFL